jgi:hypothetical protein
MQPQSCFEFEELYDTYSPMLYSILLETSPSQSHADEILCCTFQKAHAQNIAGRHRASVCASLIKFTIQCAREILTPLQFNTAQLEQRFKQTPMLSQILCENLTNENFLEENKVDRVAAAKNLRKELMALRIFQKVNTQELSIA